MNGSPEVIAGLLRIKELTSEVHESLHDQEHLWESLEFPALEKTWDQANRDVWDKIHHRILKRLYALGGRPPGVVDDETAFDNAIASFYKIHQACQKLYEIVESDRDYVTQKMLMKTQKQIEEWITYLQAKRAQAERLKSIAFMSEQM